MIDAASGRTTWLCGIRNIVDGSSITSGDEWAGVATTAAGADRCHAGEPMIRRANWAHRVRVALAETLISPPTWWVQAGTLARPVYRP